MAPRRAAAPALIGRRDVRSRCLRGVLVSLLVVVTGAACAPSGAAPGVAEPVVAADEAPTTAPPQVPASTVPGAPITTTSGTTTTTTAAPLAPADAVRELRRRAVEGGPALIADAADPFVLRDGDVWYAYATSRRRSLLQVYRSVDLVSWAALPAPLATMPSWSTGEPQWLWAPAVARLDDGTFRMFYVAKERTRRAQCIGVAVATSPAGPFVDAGTEPFVCQRDLGGSIDPSVFTDADGTRFLLWKNDGNCCNVTTRLWSAPLTDDGSAFAAAPVAVLRADRAWEGGLVENPAMVHLADGYHLLYSADRWDTEEYATGHARCATPVGPCTKTSLDGPAFTGSGATVAPGGAEIVDVQGEPWIAYHQWTTGRVARGSRGMLLAPLSMVALG